MIEIQKILCPVDRSECSRRALDHAIAIARWYEAPVTVLEVYESAPVAAVAPGIPGFPAVDLKMVDPEQLLAGLRRFVAAEASPDVTVEVLTRDGDTVREILDQADQMPADLLVLGTHGRSGFQRLVLGSVTEKILRRARCPVLSIPPVAAEDPVVAPVSYKRILCPVDFSNSSIQALRFATSLAKEADARLTVLHVMEYDLREAGELYDEFMANQHLSVADFRARQQVLSRERLEIAVSSDVRMYCSVDTAIADGKPYREILRVAAERASDLIVMGVRGRGAIDLLLFGSTTHHVVRMAGCPVLTLRS